MKVLVIGATGGSGRATVEELLEGGHEVTAFSRHADAIELHSTRLHLLPGDALDPAQVEWAVAGKDAVVVALGVHDNPLKVRLHRSKTPVDVCSRGTRNAIAAMKKHGVRKLVVLSAYGVGETRERLPWPNRLAFALFIKDQIADKELQEREVRDSGLDWVIVQPVWLTNGGPRPETHASTTGEVARARIPRRNVGRFLAAAVEDDRCLQRSVALSS